MLGRIGPVTGVTTCVGEQSSFAGPLTRVEAASPRTGRPLWRPADSRARQLPKMAIGNRELRIQSQ
jgi:hypothetical protein